MEAKEIDRIESAIRHIQTAIDVDPWAAEIAIEAMRKQMPLIPIKEVNPFNNDLYKLYCPGCREMVGFGNSRVGYTRRVNDGYERCAACGQAIDWGSDE